MTRLKNYNNTIRWKSLAALCAYYSFFVQYWLKIKLCCLPDGGCNPNKIIILRHILGRRPIHCSTFHPCEFSLDTSTLSQIGKFKLSFITAVTLETGDHGIFLYVKKSRGKKTRVRVVPNLVQSRKIFRVLVFIIISWWALDLTCQTVSLT